MNKISFITANFVAREVGYHMTQGWMQGDGATQAHFSPLETFSERFGKMLDEIKAMGFSALDLWGAHLNFAWASDEHIAQAKAALSERGMTVCSIANGMAKIEALEGFCRVASGLGVGVIAGGAPFMREQRAEGIAILKNYGVKLGIENHPEKSVQELLEQIGDGADGYIGASPDTGWWGTYAVSAPQAMRELKEHLFTVHLKDVKAAGGHETCRLGDGVADIAGCVRVLREIGYSGPMGIEHEPENFDPTQDVIDSRKRIEGWLKENA